MAYTLLQKRTAALALVRHLPGLDYRVAYAWVYAEQGVHFNILGVVTNGRLEQYASFDEGARAAATRILSSPVNYVGVRRSLSGTPHQQATAIIRCPWHLGPSGLRQAGGTDPYYNRVFHIFGLGVRDPERRYRLVVTGATPVYRTTGTRFGTVTRAHYTVVATAIGGTSYWRIVFDRVRPFCLIRRAENQHYTVHAA